MNYTSLKSIFYSFLFFTVCLNASWSSFCLRSLPFPLTVGLVYQIGKNDWNNSVRNYLHSEKSLLYYTPIDFIGYTSKRVIDKHQNIISTYVGLPPLVFIVGIFSSILATKLSSRQNYLTPVLSGFARTIAWAYAVPYKFNPFLWKRSNETLVNKVIRLG